MNLEGRKIKILKAIIDDYIKTAEPIGSRTIAKKQGLSAATIRNEMADLEEMGYLEKPHTSAGRVPSNLGYRFYVDTLMQNYKMSNDELRAVKNALKLRVRAIGKAISELSDVISGLTRYTAIVTTQSRPRESIKNVCLLPINEARAMLVVITGDDAVKNRVIGLAPGMGAEYVKGISAVLERELRGVLFSELGGDIAQKIRAAAHPYAEVADKILGFIAECEEKCAMGEVFSGGAGNMLNYPEYSDIDKARSFLSFMDKKGNLCDILEMPLEAGQVKISIGGENRFEEISDCSIVVAHYNIRGKPGGRIGIIGPTRMDYARVVSSLRHIADSLDAVLFEALQGE